MSVILSQDHPEQVINSGCSAVAFDSRFVVDAPWFYYVPVFKEGMYQGKGKYAWWRRFSTSTNSM